MISTSRADGKHQSCWALISLLFLNVFYHLVGILYCLCKYDVARYAFVTKTDKNRIKLVSNESIWVKVVETYYSTCNIETKLR